MTGSLEAQPVSVLPEPPKQSLAQTQPPDKQEQSKKPPPGRASRTAAKKKPHRKPSPAMAR